MRRLLILLAGLALAACDTPAPPKTTSPALSQGQSIASNAETFRETLAGNTLKFDGSSHGTQIEYFAPDGRAYLWYPGNRGAVPSKWKIVASKPARKPPLICFQYPSRSYNPVTREFGGKWECRPSTIFAAQVSAVVEGDPFNLSSGNLPAMMPRRANLTMKQVLALTPAQETLTYVYRK